MVNKEIISEIIEIGIEKIKPIFKERQFEVLKKLNSGEPLNENEKRYLRGNIKKKLELLNTLNLSQYNPRLRDYSDFLRILDDYYITGLEALKNNGYGWDYKTKIIEVINNKLNGEIEFSDKIVQLIRVKSIKRADFEINKTDLLKYATNEQVIKDVKITKNQFVRKKWMNQYATYGSEFSKAGSGEFE